MTSHLTTTAIKSRGTLFCTVQSNPTRKALAKSINSITSVAILTFTLLFTINAPETFRASLFAPFAHCTSRTQALPRNMMATSRTFTRTDFRTAWSVESFWTWLIAVASNPTSTTDTCTSHTVTETILSTTASVSTSCSKSAIGTFICTRRSMPPWQTDTLTVDWITCSTVLT